MVLAGATTTTGTSTVAPITAEEVAATKETEVATVGATEVAVASIIIVEEEACAEAIEAVVATEIMTISPR